MSENLKPERPDALGADDMRRVISMADGATIAATSAGAGQVVLLVSGLGGTADFWTETCLRLSAKYRAITYDHRGIGASSRGKSPLSVELMAADALRILDSFGIERALVVGHSLGGCVAQQLAAICPGRISGLVLSATWREPDAYLSRLFEMRLRLLSSDLEAYAAITGFLGYPADHLIKKPELMGATSPTFRCEIAAERIRALLAFSGSKLDWTKDFPVLVLGTMDDLIVPPHLQRALQESLPDARGHFLERGGHFFPMTVPDSLPDVLDDWFHGRPEAGRRIQ